MDDQELVQLLVLLHERQCCLGNERDSIDFVDRRNRWAIRGQSACVAPTLVILWICEACNAIHNTTMYRVLSLNIIHLHYLLVAVVRGKVVVVVKTMHVKVKVCYVAESGIQIVLRY